MEGDLKDDLQKSTDSGVGEAEKPLENVEVDPNATYVNSADMKPVDPETERVNWLLTILFALGCLITVSNLYYAQPILEYLADEFQVSRQSVGSIPSCSAGGYSLGLLFVTPLGDLLKRKPLILTLLVSSTIISLVMGFVPSNLFPLFQFLAFVSGLLTCVVQILVPLAADLSPAKQIGNVIGLVMAGLMLGILLSRVLSGIITQALGWRWMWWIGAILQALLSLAFAFMLPNTPTKMTREGSFLKQYGNLLWSCIKLLKEFPVLVQHSIIGFLNFAAFSSFWTSSTYLLSNPPYNYPTSIIGLLGIAGAVGILLAPIGGRFSDKLGGYTMVGIGTSLVIVSWCLAFMGLLSFAVPIVCACMMDTGLQVQQVANQVRIFSLRPSARSRLNAVYMIVAYAGASLAPYCVTLAYNAGGWYGSVAFGLTLCVLALIVWFIRGPNDSWRWSKQIPRVDYSMDTIVVDTTVDMVPVQPISKNKFGFTIGTRMYKK